MIKTVIGLIFLCSTVFADSSLDILEKKIFDLNLDQEKLLIEKNKIADQVFEIDKKIKGQKLKIYKRAISQKSLKNSKWVNFLSDDLTSLNLNLKILSKLSSHDSTQLINLQNEQANLNFYKKNLNDTEELIKKNIEELQNSELQIKSVEEQTVQYLKQSSQKSLLFEKKNISPPVQGQLLTKFGIYPDSEKKYVFFNAGETYKCDLNEKVKAIGPGKIIFSDHLAGWNQTLIVQHADNYYSVYAGILPNKKNDSMIAKGEVLGSCQGAKLYFELRHYAYAINPAAWYGGTSEKQ